MSGNSESDERFDLPAFWRLLEEVEEGSPEPTWGDELAAALERSPAARRAYLEYFQQSAVLRMESAKLRERGLLPLADSAVRDRRTIQFSMLAAVAVVALAGIIAALIVIRMPKPARLMAVVAPATRWSIDGVAQNLTNDPVSVIEGSSVSVESGIVRLELESGDLLVLQSPATVFFPRLNRPQLKRGWLWIDAGKSNEAFEVEAANVQVRDIGTRFGVRVPDRGPVEVHLIEGRVEVRNTKNGKVIDELGADRKAVAFDHSRPSEEILPATDPFPDLPKLLVRPVNYRTTVLSQSPSGYWSLDTVNGRTLDNEVPGSSPAFHGTAMRGDEPGVGSEDGFQGFPESNRSFYLQGESNRSVLIDLHGRHGVSLSEGAISFWVRRAASEIRQDEVLWLAGLGSEEMTLPQQAILHTRITQSGHIVFEINHGNTAVHLSSARSIANDRWHHVAASWGPSSVALYLDGYLIGRDVGPRAIESTNFRGRFVRFGKPSKDQHDRYGSFTGWVDEIAMWERPLSWEEITHQVDAARGPQLRSKREAGATSSPEGSDHE